MNQNDINAEFYDLIYSDEKGELVTSAECTLISSLAGEPSKSILDVGAGTGRHAVRLAEMGYKVTAIDLSKGMLKILKEKNVQGLKVVYCNIYKYKTKVKYDMIIMMWNVFNEIALTKKDARRLISKLRKMLNKDGKILINIENVSEDKVYIPEFKFEKEIKGLGKVKVDWTNIKVDPKTNVTISKEQIWVNSKIQKPALIKQRWWKLNEIKKIVIKNLSLNKIENNNELYFIISS